MRILDLKRAVGDGRSQMRLLATFDLELSEQIRMYGLKLMEAPDGRRFAYAPNANGGSRTATFDPALAQEITELATLKMEGHVIADGQNQPKAA
ncbi:hypothetical protein [Rhizobium tumorigenes]|uniref:hypothetical protein n=1 Tax=Rhizobium tumorigenes TaxID=2041385 RepID=UPI00241D9703|nr:hypothetical protein [Rhizobium tumorigenes]WFS02792.1 hypothetical protein PR016_09395 [Rhizobium tumorigenes]